MIVMASVVVSGAVWPLPSLAAAPMLVAGPSVPADTILTNGHVMTPSGWAQALAVYQDRPPVGGVAVESGFLNRSPTVSFRT